MTNGAVGAALFDIVNVQNWTMAPPPAEHEPGHDMDYLTNFERKFRQQGKPIHRMRFVKA